MKKAIALAAIFAGTLSLSACNFDTSTDADTQTTTNEQQAEPTETPTGETVTATAREVAAETLAEQAENADGDTNPE